MPVAKTATVALLLILIFGGASFVRDKMLIRGGLLVAGCGLALAAMFGLLG